MFKTPHHFPDIALWKFLTGTFLAGALPAAYACFVTWRVRITHGRPLKHTLLWFSPEPVAWFYFMFLFRHYPITGPMQFFT